MRAEISSRTALFALFILGVAGLFFLQGETLVQLSDRRIGLSPAETAAGLSVLAVEPGHPAARAGISAGDQIVAVNGRAVERVEDYLRLAQAFERERPVLFRVFRDGRTLEVPVAPGVPVSWGPFLVTVLIALCYVGIALLAWSQGGDLRARLLGGFAGAVALELALPAGTIAAPALRLVAVSGYFLLTGLQIGLELHLASLLPERQAWLRRRPWVVPLYYVAGTGLGTLACVTLVAEELLGGADGRFFPWTAAGAQALLINVGVPVWALVLSFLLGAQALRYPEPRGRHQAGLVLAGVLPWLFVILAGTVLRQLGQPAPEWLEILEPVVQLWYPIAFFAAIFRFHLFDIELVVRRSLIYTALTGALVLVFYAAVGAGGALLSYLVGGQQSVWAVSLATLLLGLLFSPLRRALHSLIGRRFFPERYALRQRLVGLAGELPAFGKLPLMGHHLAGRLTTIFGARSAYVLLADPETGLLGVLAAASRRGGVDDTHSGFTGGDGAGGDTGQLLLLDDPGVELLRRSRRPLPWSQLTARSPGLASRFPGMDATGLAVPLLTHDRLIGVLFVGRKHGSRRYPAEELDLLNLLAHHVATVFENARLFESATYEGLTGLLRREAILAQLGRELERAARYGRPLTIAMADLDYFKEINDRYGHLSGDALLRRIAQVMAEGLRSTDWIGRYGGEEFLLVLPETDVDGATAVAEKIRALVQRTAVLMETGGPVRVTISVGLASLREVAEEGGRDREVTARDLIAAADRALYEAKHRGRNQVVSLGAVA